jgi:hypothetical protein
MTVWQPIETAPKDGTDILCFSPGNRRAHNGNARKPYWKVDFFRDRGGGFGGFYRELPEAHYTHWAPLSFPLPTQIDGGERT